MTSNLAVSDVKALWRNIEAIKATHFVFQIHIKLLEEDIITKLDGVAPLATKMKKTN